MLLQPQGEHLKNCLEVEIPSNTEKPYIRAVGESFENIKSRKAKQKKTKKKKKRRSCYMSERSDGYSPAHGPH